MLVDWYKYLGEIFNNTCGVLQGGVVSPLLFTMFLEDLPKYLNSKYGVTISDSKICHLLQADDLVLISETEYGLKQLLKGLEKYCNRWHVILNILKTKIMIFNKKYIIGPQNFAFVFNGIPIDETDKYKYLGTIFGNQNKTFQLNFKNTRTNAMKAIGSLRQKLKISLCVFP